MDLSKAFDTIDRDILFTKLQHYGIRDAALQWIKSYFSYRYQFVQFNQTCSPMQTIKCGVPQGSILGPLFFILYINDLQNASELVELLLLADDTSIFYSHSNPNTLEFVLNNEIKNIEFLGVYIDEHLTWKDHISYLCKQISKSIGILFRSRFYLSSNSKLTLYYSLIYPYITYWNSTWSSTYVTNLNRPQWLQVPKYCN